MANYYAIRKWLCLFLVSLISIPAAIAQQAGISGTVTDAGDHSAIPGASIQVKGSSTGTITDDKGRFVIAAHENDVLIISYLSYLPQQVTVNGQSVLKVLLSKNTHTLDELVVTALGVTKQERQVGYAIQALNSKQFANVPDPNLVNDLNGKVAGVTITNGGAGVGSTSRIVIRGENSFSGSNQPLFVVDGVPINNETFFNDAIENSSNQGTWAEVDWGNGAAELKPDDISKITILKGAAAAALYGSRASNGAIVLTTKTGVHEKGMTGISLRSTTTLETPLILPRIQNQYGAGNGKQDYQFVDGAQSYENNIPNFGEKFDPNTLVPQFDSPAGTYQAGDLSERSLHPGTQVTPTPWIGHSDNFRNFLQTGLTTSNSLSFGGAGDNGSYYFSFGNLYNRGILPGTDLRRNSVTLRTEHRFNDRLTSNVFIDYINSNSSNRPNIGYGSESVMYTFFGVYGMPININLNSLKNKLWQAGRTDISQFRYWKNHDNPYVTLFDNTNSFNKNRIIGNASLKYDFTRDLSLMARTGTDYYADNREGHRAFSTVRFPTGGFRTDDVSYFENNTDFLLNYNKDLGSKFKASVSLGGNRFMQNISYTRNIANALITPGLYNFSNAQNQLPTLLEKYNKVVYSLYGFGDFTYKNLLFLNLTARNDWSSTLPLNHNSFFYPSASLSGIISDMVHLPKAVSYLKLRVSAAQVGHDADPYSITNTYLTNTPFNAYPLTTADNVLANNNLKPSTTNSMEAGINLRFFGDRAGVDVTLYHSDTRDEVVQLPIPVSSGYTNAYVNGGRISNKGVEITLSLTPFRSTRENGFSWDMNFNFSHNTGKVISLPQGINTYKYAQVTQYDRYYRAIQYNAVVGEKLGNMYGNAFVRDPQGNIVYKNGVPLITTDQNHLLGNYNPDFILGWFNNLSYKNFSLDFVWDWHQGGKFYSYTELGILNGGMSVETLPGRETGIVGKGVMADGSGKYIPNTVKVDAATYYLGYYNANNNEAFMYDASYLKLRELKLGYTFKHLFGGASPANLNVSFIGRNLLLFTQNKDVDPETLALRGQKILPGTEFLSIPSTRSMGVSIGLNF